MEDLYSKSNLGKRQRNYSHTCNTQQTLVLVKKCWRPLENVLKTSLEEVFKHVLKTPWKMRSCYAEDVLDIFKMSWKTRNVCLDQAWIVLLVLHTQTNLTLIKILHQMFLKCSSSSISRSLRDHDFTWRNVSLIYHRPKKFPVLGPAFQIVIYHPITRYTAIRLLLQCNSNIVILEKEQPYIAEFPRGVIS